MPYGRTIGTIYFKLQSRRRLLLILIQNNGSIPSRTTILFPIIGNSYGISQLFSSHFFEQQKRRRVIRRLSIRSFSPWIFLLNISSKIFVHTNQTLPLQLESKEIGRPSINIIFRLKTRLIIQLQLSFIHFNGQTIFGITRIGNGSSQHFKISKHSKSISKPKEILGQIFPLILYFI